MKRTIAILLMVLFLPLVSAQYIQPMDCDYNPETEFTEPAEVCFYGSNFDGDNVDVSLGDYDTITVEVSNGIVTSVGGNEFTNVPEGTYDLVVEDVVQFDGKVNVYAQGEIPEFSTLTALMVVGLAGLFVALRRK